ncbi:C-terminal binding protein [Paenibacillus sp. TRM 82003]|uniref:C-terminal binding protein n=1 Tax=Kineococcus sp. TRM81007 TaxID=2925831 RepID=UPI001F565B65|nr:C-terminal binding protein [Kineococcus sp. TRM81007]MCI2239475.1 C-terminal binding protein [Kineococcus sp. TRM81007]MCI3919275.1 C-terminal binding protein [Paenibacillus sp. TRM 82003]
MKIVITECDHDSFEPEEAVATAAGIDLVLARSRSQAEVVENAAGAEGVLVQYARITADVMDALPGLRAVGRYGVGVDSVDVEAATARGIAVCNVPDYGVDAVSDHALALALAASRGLVRMDRSVRAGRPDLAAVRPVHALRGRTFGVVGTGRIGTATARKAAALGFEVIGHDPGCAGPDDVPLVGLDELLERSHVVSLHAPLTDGTRGLIGRERLARVRPDAVLVNTSRGGLVDTDALVEALQRGRLAGAGLDVTDPEPLPAGHPLLGMDQVVLTPHLAWYTEESYAELKRRTAANVVDVLAGRRPRDVLNPQVLGAPGRNSAFPVDGDRPAR